MIEFSRAWAVQLVEATASLSLGQSYAANRAFPVMRQMRYVGSASFLSNLQLCLLCNQDQKYNALDAPNLDTMVPVKESLFFFVLTISNFFHFKQ